MAVMVLVLLVLMWLDVPDQLVSSVGCDDVDVRAVSNCITSGSVRYRLGRIASGTASGSASGSVLHRLDPRSGHFREHWSFGFSLESFNFLHLLFDFDFVDSASWRQYRPQCAFNLFLKSSTECMPIVQTFQPAIGVG